MDSNLRFRIQIITPQGTEEKYVDGDSFVLGRGADCDLTIRHDKVSRKHLSFAAKDGKVWLEDLGSSNGSYINEIVVVPLKAVELRPAEKIQIGNSDIYLSVQLESNAKPIEPVASPLVKYDPQPALAKENTFAAPAAKAEMAREASAELLLKQARKKASSILLEAESAAEGRVQEIYQRANDKQKKAEEFYRQRMRDAHEEARRVIDAAGEEGRELIVEARNRSQHVRNEVDRYCVDLRKQAESECSAILSSAEVQGRESKERMISEAQELLRTKEASIFEAAQKDVAQERARIMDEVNAKVSAELESHKERMNLETSIHMNDIAELDKNIEILSQRLNELKSLILIAEENNKNKNQELALIETRVSDIKNTFSNELKQQEVMKIEVEQLKKLQLTESEKLKKLILEKSQVQGELVKVKEQFDLYEEKSTNLKRQFEAENLVFKEKLEDAKGRFLKIEEEYADKIRLQTVARIGKIEIEMMEELRSKKDQLSREIILNVESIFQNDIPRGARKDKLKDLEKQTQALISAQISTLGDQKSADVSNKKFVLQKRRSQYLQIAFGAFIGAVLIFGVQGFLVQVGKNHSPLQERAEMASREKQLDLKQRRFEPVQVRILKDNYTDAVIYTKGFAEIYLDPAYQKRWFSAATSYLLRTWRLDEALSIQVLSNSAALVKVLESRRQSIHPDFVKEGIGKMRELEKESVRNLVSVLGSQVRLESFKKFEKEFYEKELKMRSASSGLTN